ncbi:hypothetical protein [Terribacillus sp. 7520-G]|nr:hypothetical protein CHH53_03910 [Terribacillus sp. 7520-G]
MIEVVSQKVGLTQDQVSAVLSNAVITIDSTLAIGEEVQLTNYESYVI